jgi:hypothetical protein
MRYISFLTLVLIIAMAAALSVSASVIEAQFSKPPGFPDDARCLVEVFVGDQYCTSQDVGENDQWHATLQYDFDPAQKVGRAVFSIPGASDWGFRRPEQPFQIKARIGLGLLKPERREKVVSNALKESRQVTESSQKKSPARIEKAEESLKGAAVAATTNKDKAELIVEWNDLAAVSKASETPAKKFVMSELPKLKWEGFNFATTKSIFIAASGVAEKFTQQKGGKKNALGLYGEAADANPEVATVWDTVTATYAKVNPEYAKAIANPASEAIAESGSERAFKEDVFRKFLYSSPK